MDIRRIWTCKDVVFAEGGLPALKPVTAGCSLRGHRQSGGPGEGLDDLSDSSLSAPTSARCS